jgi:hypothetical protein
MKQFVNKTLMKIRHNISVGLKSVLLLNINNFLLVFVAYESSQDNKKQFEGPTKKNDKNQF